MELELLPSSVTVGSGVGGTAIVAAHDLSRAVVGPISESECESGSEVEVTNLFYAPSLCGVVRVWLKLPC